MAQITTGKNVRSETNKTPTHQETDTEKIGLVTGECVCCARKASHFRCGIELFISLSGRLKREIYVGSDLAGNHIHDREGFGFWFNTTRGTAKRCNERCADTVLSRAGAKLSGKGK